jgi:hypothetical protein
MSNIQNLERGKQVFESIFTSNTECLRNFIEREDIVLPEDKYGPQGQQNHLGIRFTQAAEKKNKEDWYKKLGVEINELYSPVPEDLKLLINLLNNPDNRTEQNVNNLKKFVQNYNKNSVGSCSEALEVPPVVPPEGPEGPEGPEVPPVVPEGTPEFLGDVFGDVTGPEHTQVNTTRLRNPGFWGSTDLAKK